MPFFLLLFLEIPEAPTEISVVNKTYSSIILRWLDDDTADYPGHELIYRIKYKSQWDTNAKRWTVSVQM